jgi:hypothetical protein
MPEIDAELFGDKANEFIGKKEKNLVSGASLKQAMLSAQNLAFGDKLSMHSAQSQNVVELMRASQVLQQCLIPCLGLQANLVATRTQAVNQVVSQAVKMAVNQGLSRVEDC